MSRSGKWDTNTIHTHINTNTHTSVTVTLFVSASAMAQQKGICEQNCLFWAWFHFMYLGNLKVTCHQPPSYEIMSAALIRKMGLQASESKELSSNALWANLSEAPHVQLALGYLPFRVCNTALDVAYRILSDSVLIFIFFFLAEIITLLLFSNISNLPGKQGSESSLTLSFLPSQKGLNTGETFCEPKTALSS